MNQIKEPLAMKHKHSLDYACLSVGHASMSEEDTNTYDYT